MGIDTAYTSQGPPGVNQSFQDWIPKLSEIQWVRLQGPADNNAISYPNAVQICRNAGVQHLIVYQLEDYWGGPSGAALNNCAGVPVRSFDGYQVYAIADPAYRSAWQSYTSGLVAQYGVDQGVWIDSPGYWSGCFNDSPGVQNGTDAEIITNYTGIRSAVGTGYIIINAIGTGGNSDLLMNYADDVIAETPFSTFGDYGVTNHYDPTWCDENLSTLYHFAFERFKNVTLYLEGVGGSAESDIFQCACCYLFVGHPYNDVYGTGVPSQVRFDILPQHALSSRDPAYFQGLMHTYFDGLGQPTAPPVRGNLVYTRTFQNGTLTVTLQGHGWSIG